MLALSIRQPWAWMIIYAGKEIENRDWKNNGPNMRQARALASNRAEFYIHASAGMTRSEYDDCIEVANDAARVRPFHKGIAWPGIEALPRGGIVGVARIVDVVCDHPSPWFFGPVGLVIADARPIPFRPLKGQRGFFQVP